MKGGPVETSALNSAPVSDPAARLLAFAALFPGTFSIDWLLDLTQQKASAALDALQQAMHRGWICSNQAGKYAFRAEEDRQRCLRALGPQETETACRRAADIILGDSSQDPEKSVAAAGLLLNVANDAEGCQRLIAAGEVLRKGFRTVEALKCYRKALEDLQRLGGDEAAERVFVAAAIQFSKLSAASDDASGVIRILEKAEKKAGERGLTAEQALLRMHLAKHEWLRSRYRVALGHFETAWGMSRDLEDDYFQRSARVFRMYFHYWQGRFKDAVQSYEQYVPEIEKIPIAHFPLLARLTIGSCYAHCGQITEGIGMLDAIRRHCLKAGDLGLASHALLTIAMILCETGRADEAAGLFDTALSQSIEGHNAFAQVSAQLGKAYSRHLMGQPAEAACHLREFLNLGRRIQVGLRNYPMVMEMCWAITEGTLPPVDGLSLEEEIRGALGSGNIFMEGVGYRYRALSLQRQGSAPRRVIGLLRRAVRLLEASGHRLQIAAARLDMSRALLAAGMEPEARQAAGSAVADLVRINSRLVPDDLRHLTDDLRSEKHLLREILSLGQELVSLRAHRDLVARVLSAACRLTGAERGAIFVAADGGRRFDLQAARNLTSEEVAAADFAGSLERIRETCRSAKGCVVELAAAGARMPSETAICGCICVPLVLRRQTLGVLYLDNRRVRSTFAPSDTEILDYFAAQASIAMENARAFDVLQDQYRKQKQEAQYHEQQVLERLNFEEIIGSSLAIRRVFAQIDAVAQTDATTLILGETGVGKELVARAIHRTSRRKDGPFIRVNCSAYAEHLIASELFGHERGAFTGATQRHLGRFELADGGTLFLDEIGDIPLPVQVQLLRVLQSKEFERVGGQTTIRSDFRLMAATNRDLTAIVRAGGFRQDLYYRINVFPIKVPPLRDRLEDIALLANHFLAMYAKQQNKKIDRIPPEELAKLMAYPWPGNVRELENIIERGVILCTGTVFHVPETGLGGPAPEGGPAPQPHLTHAENERAHIVRVLKLAGGKVAGPAGAAKILGLHPNTLRYRMKKLAISPRLWEMRGLPAGQTGV
jgi:formate hydrogenlyase transcriptional activator